MVRILLNGAPREVAANLSVGELLDAEGYAQRKVAVEVNREIVPKSLHAQRTVRDGDRIEIVHAIGGG
ncbi:MAG TPA: sulfur carrier protein ThiS [Rudaea sp.]|nr:sulfur carrier protein ThiS [Rudaea sp.]HSC10271.1 sulfur carrier protein ThiS [Rhodanobacteraceae bacterium]